MKKTVLLSLFMAMMGISAAQVETFDLNHMPENYHLEDWPDSGSFTFIHKYTDSVWGMRALYTGVPICIGPSYGITNVYGYDFWNIPNIRNFAVGKHSDTPISVAGIAFLYPRFKWDMTVGTRYSIRNEWLSHGYDLLKLQLMDTGMNVLSEGTSLLSDTVGNPILQINVNSYPQEVDLIPPSHMDYGNYGPVTFDIYEAMFPVPVTVVDSFYLALHFESSKQNKVPLSLPVPGIYELLAMNQNSNYALYSDYDFPKCDWVIQAAYRYRPDIGYINDSLVYEMTNDDNWFTYEACEEKHGYMLIFPILETSCHVPTGLRWNPMGGGKVRLSWESGTWDTEWEVSYGLSGIAPEDGTIITATSTSAQLSGIGTDTHYVAYVRTKCVVRDTVWSDWSDSISIFLSTQGIDNMDKDGGIALQPNPASNSVLLTTEAPLAGIDVYTAAGAFYKHLPASGNTADIDVSSWPSGTYLLHISTPLGVTTKKLIVQ